MRREGGGKREGREGSEKRSREQRESSAKKPRDREARAAAEVSVGSGVGAGSAHPQRVLVTREAGLAQETLERYNRHRLARFRRSPSELKTHAFRSTRMWLRNRSGEHGMRSRACLIEDLSAGPAAPSS